MADFDLILAGGGLAAGLIAMRLADVRPNLSVAIVEGGETIGGDHIWSSFRSDLRGPQLMWTDELFGHRWEDGYKVRFPKYERELSTGYGSVRSEALDRAVRERLPQGAVITGTRLDKVLPTYVRTEAGQVLKAGAVIDCRGFKESKYLTLAWQKFVGVEIECKLPHGRTKPVVMDASVPQLDGYRFVYVLPMSETRLLVEDTYYSDAPQLFRDELLGRVRAYIEGMDVGPHEEDRVETGVLPIALDGDIEGFWDLETLAGSNGPVPRAGMAAALFHPVTGYSFPDAVETADRIKSMPRLDAGPLFYALRDLSVQKWEGRGFYRLLNRMMFEAAAPDQRYRTLQHFYALDEALVERFYAGESTKADMLCILSGKPPVPVTKALAVLAKSAKMPRWRPRWLARDD